MTAIDRYQRLECTGLWRATATAQLREVVVGLREATLVLADPRTSEAVTHWSLPAIERVNPGDLPAIFTAGRLDDGTPAETLELDEPEMIAALETVHVALVRRRPHPGRLRGVMLVLGVTVVAAIGTLWLPGAMIRHTASVLPEATRVQMGKLALADLARLSGSPCNGTLGKRGAADLAAQLSKAGVGEIAVVRDAVDPSVVLPGGLVVVNARLVEKIEDPEVTAGYVVAAALQAELRDPVIPLLEHAGLVATMRLLTTGSLPAGAVDGYAETLLKATPLESGDDPLLALFQKVGLSSTAYGRALDPTGEKSLGLIEADPFKGTSPAPIMSDNDWISLQAVCEG